MAQIDRDFLGSPAATPPNALAQAQAALAAEATAASGEESSMYAEMAPKGQFSKPVLNSLAKSLNKALPAFGVTEPVAAPESDANILPEDMTRMSAMIVAAANEAASAEVVGPEQVPSLDGIADDTGLRMFAGQVDTLAKDKGFKQWLRKPEETNAEEAQEEMAEEPEEMAQNYGGNPREEMDDEDLFASRM